MHRGRDRARTGIVRTIRSRRTLHVFKTGDTADRPPWEGPEPVGQRAEQPVVEVHRASAHPGRDPDLVSDRPLQFDQVQIEPGPERTLEHADVADRNALDTGALEGGQQVTRGTGLRGRGRERGAGSEHERKAEGDRSQAGMPSSTSATGHSALAFNDLLIASTMKFCMDGSWPRTAW